MLGLCCCFVFVSVCVTQYRVRRFQILDSKVGGEVFVFINSKVYEILYLRCFRLIILPDVNQATRSVQLVCTS